MRTEEIMSSPVFTCHTQETLNVAAHVMWEHDCGAIPIVNDKGKLVGMLTDRDICMAAYTQGRPLDEIPIHLAMAKHVQSVRREQPVAEVEELMASQQLRRIPVVDPAGIPIGIVTVNDLTREAVRPTSHLKGGLTKVMQTLASICTTRRKNEKAA